MTQCDHISVSTRETLDSLVKRHAKGQRQTRGHLQASQSLGEKEGMEPLFIFSWSVESLWMQSVISPFSLQPLWNIQCFPIESNHSMHYLHPTGQCSCQRKDDTLKWIVAPLLRKMHGVKKKTHSKVFSSCYGSTLKMVALPSHTISERELHPSLLVPTTEF